MTAHPINGQTWIICGGRDFSDQEMFDSAMNSVMTLRGCPSQVVQGGATGADALARAWAKRMAVPCATEEANWAAYGNAAGPIRNRRMLDEWNPVSAVIAFPGGRGTADMVRKARGSLVDVIEIVPSREEVDQQEDVCTEQL